MNDIVTGLTLAYDTLDEAKDALRQCEATITQLRRERDTAQLMETYWQQQHAEAWIQIGRLDYALEQIVKATTTRDMRRWAAKMRAELKDRGKKK